MTEHAVRRPLLQRLSSWPLFLVLLVLYLVVFRLLMQGMGDSADNPPLDLMFSYTPDQVYTNLSALGEEGRKTRVLVSSTLDTAYPLIYSSLFAVLITLTTHFLGLTHKGWIMLAHLPFAALIFDLAENTSIIVMALQYPDTMTGLARMASVFTSLKWISVSLVIGAAGMLSMMALVRRLKR
ncbi:MAG: hypothetical protein COA84_01935 [Robiginitomaculum sp.]|nr:MAG: hypothetical protein COA84_01935 [Robiginitomaculum sp.]